MKGKRLVVVHCAERRSLLGDKVEVGYWVLVQWQTCEGNECVISRTFESKKQNRGLIVQDIGEDRPLISKNVRAIIACHIIEHVPVDSQNKRETARLLTVRKRRRLDCRNEDAAPWDWGQCCEIPRDLS